MPCCLFDCNCFLVGCGYCWDVKYIAKDKYGCLVVFILIILLSTLFIIRNKKRRAETERNRVAELSRYESELSRYERLCGKYVYVEGFDATGLNERRGCKYRFKKVSQIILEPDAIIVGSLKHPIISISFHDGAYSLEVYSDHHEGYDEGREYYYTSTTVAYNIRFNASRSSFEVELVEVDSGSLDGDYYDVYMHSLGVFERIGAQSDFDPYSSIHPSEELER